jgi:hydroxymethylbilane synthase
MQHLKVSTRSSPLALSQTQLVKAWLTDHGCQFDDDVTVLTQGDKDLSSRLDQKGGKGLFIKEVEQCLLDDRAQLAVHSCKDMPLQEHQELILAGLLGGAAPFDVLVGINSVMNLPQKAKVGTSSLRRAAQLLQLRPDITCIPLRGNVGTRVHAWRQGDFDAIILAQAGLDRLEMDLPYCVLQPHEMVPAFNQGILGIQVKKSHHTLMKLLSDMTDPLLRKRYEWERSIARCFEIDCQSSVGVLVEPSLNDLSKVWVFAYKNNNLYKYAHHAFYNLMETIAWVESTFALREIDWRRCEPVF